MVELPPNLPVTDGVIITAALVLGIRFGLLLVRDVLGWKGPVNNASSTGPDQSQLVHLLTEIRDSLTAMKQSGEEVRREDVRHQLLTEQTATIIKTLENKLFICPMIPHGASGEQLIALEDRDGNPIG